MRFRIAQLSSLGVIFNSTLKIPVIVCFVPTCRRATGSLFVAALFMKFVSTSSSLFGNFCRQNGHVHSSCSSRWRILLA
ncbi:hypothetical protein QTG54_014402 [Skeletonema marinoi]|uniref:Uncharacterized protein n=1 Tax=Skeletonema marinoi TaxID=267567 RepID=A0AAD8XWF7_9STRA|nr:hypothetical protein QTG54_014402 [Skeletonema marinoi]